MQGGGKMRKAESVANYIIAESLHKMHPVSNLQLQKILYYVQVHFLKKTKRPFFSDDIEAWQFGPVVPKIYYKYAGFGPAPITVVRRLDIDLDTREREDLDSIIKEKMMLSPWDMVEDTHQAGKPWAMYYKEGERNVIPLKAMELYG